MIAAATDLSAVAVLDHLDLGVQASVLREQGTGLAFVHELVREAIAADMTAARRAYTHRQVAHVLLGRSRHDPISVAFHARLGGEVDIAARALHDAATIAVGRHDLEQADQLLSEALLLMTSASLHLARARVRMARSSLDDAADDVAAAIALDPSAEAFELAGLDRLLPARLRQPRITLPTKRCGEPATRASKRARWRSAGASGIRTAISRRPTISCSEPKRSRPSRCADSPTYGSERCGCTKVAPATRCRCSIGRCSTSATSDIRLPRSTRCFAQSHAYGMLGAIDRAFKSLDAMRDVTLRAGEIGQRFLAVVANLESWLLCAVGQYSARRPRSTRGARSDDRHARRAGLARASRPRRTRTAPRRRAGRTTARRSHR